MTQQLIAIDADALDALLGEVRAIRERLDAVEMQPAPNRDVLRYNWASLRLLIVCRRNRKNVTDVCLCVAKTSKRSHSVGSFSER